MSKRLIIIDGNSLLFRAYYATAYAGVDKIMRTSTGQPTNAIFAFSNMMVKIINDLTADDHLFVAFDTGAKTFRHHEYSEYKAGRQEVPNELISQFAIAREFLDAMAIKHHEIDGYEADDLAGSLAKKASAAGYQVELYTSDQDYFQLIDKNTVVKLIKKGLSDVLTLTPETLVNEYGFTAEQVTDFKGLTGDASDNLKGIPGVGKVTALKLLSEYENLDNILANAANIKGKLGENITKFGDLAQKSKYLATIITDIPLTDNLDDFHYSGFDRQEIQTFANKYELRTFLNNLKYQNNTPDVKIDAQLITSSAELREKTIKYFAFYVDADDTNYYNATPTDVYFSVDKNVYQMTFTHFKGDKLLQEYLTNSQISKYSYDVKRAAIMFDNNGLRLSGPLNDVAIIAYITDTNIGSTVEAYLTSNGIPFSDDKRMMYISLVANLVRLYESGIKTLRDNNLLDVYLTIEKPLTNVLFKMEQAGFSVDKTILDKLGEEYKMIINRLSIEIFTLAGHEFNINSPQQVGNILFDELGLPTNKKRSTAVDVLNYLKDKHPIIPLILEYRKYQKIISNYIDGLLPHIYADGKVHTSFNQALTTTGRLSSNNPNLQNISVRAEEGREVRKAFYAVKKQILSLDYSQIELRLLACIANATDLIDVFNADRDIHSETAARLFPLEDADYARRKAKAVNFGIVYGISDFGLAEQLDIAVGEARSIIHAFYENYPEIKRYRETIINDVQTNGFVTTLTGRKRYLPQINDANYQTREFAKRAAMNAPIQGSAADLIKLAMIKVDAFLTNGNYKTKLILQVHDELIFALDPNEEEIISKLVDIMENIFALPLKLKVGVSVGANWFEAS